MGPEIALLAALSSSKLPKVPRAMTPTEAILASCERQDADDVDGAIQILRAANDAAELTPFTTIPPEY
jgi:hypothetical protein